MAWLNTVGWCLSYTDVVWLQQIRSTSYLHLSALPVADGFYGFILCILGTVLKCKMCRIKCRKKHSLNQNIKHIMNHAIQSLNWDTGYVGFHQMMSNASRSMDQSLLLRPEEASYQQRNPLVHPPLLPPTPASSFLSFSPITYFFYSSSLSSISSSILLPLYSSSSSFRCTGMLWCICLQDNSSPYATTVFWPSPPSPPLRRPLLPSHWSQCFSLPSCRQQSVSSLCRGLLLEREAALQVNCAFVSICLPQPNNLTP